MTKIKKHKLTVDVPEEITKIYVAVGDTGLAILSSFQELEPIEQLKVIYTTCEALRQIRDQMHNVLLETMLEMLTDMVEGDEDEDDSDQGPVRH